MTRKELPAPVQQLIQQHFASAADVDTLLLLRREPRDWTAAAVARQLRMDTEQAGTILARLHETGLLGASDGQYRFEPRDQALAGAAATLAQLYPAYRMAVVSLIYGRPTGAISDFS